MPDPDPTNREPQEVLSYVLDHAPGNRHWNPQLTAANCLRALESSGYQIVPKVEQGVDYSDQARSDADQGVSSRIVDVLRQAYFDWGNDPPQILTALNAAGYQIALENRLSQALNDLDRKMSQELSEKVAKGWQR